MDMQSEVNKDRFASIPHKVLDSPAYIGASHRAKAMLMELCRQLTATNNGQLQLTSTWLSKRGWASHDSIQKARDELFKRGLIVRTRQGGLHRGPTLYGVPWRPIK